MMKPSNKGHLRIMDKISFTNVSAVPLYFLNIKSQRGPAKVYMGGDEKQIIYFAWPNGECIILSACGSSQAFTTALHTNKQWLYHTTIS
jgi:hypothetical protein